MYIYENGSSESHREYHNVGKHPNTRPTELGAQVRAGELCLKGRKEKATGATWNRRQDREQHEQEPEGPASVTGPPRPEPPSRPP